MKLCILQSALLLLVSLTDSYIQNHYFNFNSQPRNKLKNYFIEMENKQRDFGGSYDRTHRDSNFTTAERAYVQFYVFFHETVAVHCLHPDHVRLLNT